MLILNSNAVVLNVGPGKILVGHGDLKHYETNFGGKIEGGHWNLRRSLMGRKSRKKRQFQSDELLFNLH